MNNKIQFPPSTKPKDCRFCRTPRSTITVACGWCGRVHTYVLAHEEELETVILTPQGAEALNDRVAT